MTPRSTPYEQLGIFLVVVCNQNTQCRQGRHPFLPSVNNTARTSVYQHFRILIDVVSNQNLHYCQGHRVLGTVDRCKGLVLPSQVTDVQYYAVTVTATLAPFAPLFHERDQWEQNGTKKEPP